MLATADSNVQSGQLRAPGIHFEMWTPDKAAGFRTGVPAFVGFVSETGRKNEGYTGDTSVYLELTRWEQFTTQGWRGAFDGYLEYAVRGFFENGGERCVVIPLKGVERNRAAMVSALKKPFTLTGSDPSGKGGVLEDLENIDLVCVPDLMTAEIRDSLDAIFEVQTAILDHCAKLGNRFAILDMPPRFDNDVNASVGVKMGERERLINYWKQLPSAEGALYTPWIEVDGLAHLSPKNEKSEPPRRSASLRPLIPPCGHVAGIYARVDAMDGVYKAPANEVVKGAVDLESHFTEDDQAQLNHVGINCLRAFPRRGIRVWGARTLNRQPMWRYVNVRRLFLTLYRWVEQNTRDLVFEPNSPPLWDRARRRMVSYCYYLYQQGALQGATAAEAYYVKCDAETNPVEEREAGKLVLEVGLAPVVPAEFVVVRITQSTSGVSVNTPTAI